MHQYDANINHRSRGIGIAQCDTTRPPHSTAPPRKPNLPDMSPYTA
jgi:hypothetical protein